jgi:hypothetical protein
MESKSKQLTAKLIELRKAIKRKYKKFKEGTEESDLLLEKQYKPLIKELRKTSSTNTDIKTEKSTIKEEKDDPMDYDEEEEHPLDFESSTEDGNGEEGEGATDSFTPDTVSTPKRHQSSELVSTPLQEASTSQFINFYFKKPITRSYMNTFFKDAGGKDKTIDYVYGPQFVDGSKLMVGDKNLDFDSEGNILVGGINYGSSEGLYELLFKKKPDKGIYKEEDLSAYRSILFASSAHRDGNKPNGRIRSNNGYKYTRIIKKLFPSSGRGMGQTWKTTKFRDIIYWDNPNELVQRLEHLVSSTETGNREHANEIISIVEELREAGFIKGLGNSRFKSLIK